MSKNKNICMVYWYYLPQLGGIETLMHSFAKELGKRDYNLHILAGPCKNEGPEPDNTTVTRTDLLDRSVLENKNMDKDLFDFITNYIKENNIDVLHLHNFQRPHAINHTSTLYHAAKNLGIPIILQVHHRPFENVERKIISSYDWDRILTVSKWVGEGVLESGVDSKNIEILYNCVDNTVFHPEKKDSELRKKFGVKEDEKLILCPTRLVGSTGEEVTRKRYKDLLKAASILSEKMDDFKLLITAIENPNFEKKCKEIKNSIKEKAELFDIKDKLIIPDSNIPQETMPSLYSSSELVVLPSVKEAFGIVYIEAMASGVPVIGTTSGAVPEVIKHKITGRLIEPKNTFSLSQAIYHILRDEDTYQKYSDNGIKHVSDYFSSKKITDQLISVYKDL